MSVELGAHGELLSRDGVYAEIHRAYEQGRGPARTTSDVVPAPVVLQPTLAHVSSGAS